MSDFEENSETLCLNLLDQCMRALGEIQVLSPTQPILLGAVVDSPMSLLLAQASRIEQVLMLEMTPPAGQNITMTPEQMAVINSTRVDLVFAYEFFACDTLTNHVSNIGTITNWKTFIDINSNPTHLFAEELRFPGLNALTNAQKESWYWAHKTRFRDTCLVPAILDSAKQLNCKKWLLPNGVEVGFDDVKPISLEVISTHSYVFQIRRLHQTGGIVGHENAIVIPYVMLDEDLLTKNPYLPIQQRRVIPSGITRTHYVIEAKLPNGGSYIVDPTSIHFNYRGPGGSIIAHGTWEEYEKGFPGKIIQRITTAQRPVAYITQTNPPTKFVLKNNMDEMYFMGEGPQKFITRMVENLVTHKDRRFCGYCGWIEGPHSVSTNSNVRYEFKAVVLMNCGQCKQIRYCDKVCQKAHWKAHRKECGKPVKEKKKSV